MFCTIQFQWANVRKHIYLLRRGAFSSHFYRSRASLSLSREFVAILLVFVSLSLARTVYSVCLLPIWNVNLMREWYIKNIVYACCVFDTNALFRECVNIEQIETQIKPFGLLLLCYILYSSFLFHSLFIFSKHLFHVHVYPVSINKQ